MKTIALQEKTFEMLEELKKKEKAGSFDKLVSEIIMERKKIPHSLRGSLRGKSKPFTRKEREELWKDVNRI